MDHDAGEWSTKCALAVVGESKAAAPKLSAQRMFERIEGMVAALHRWQGACYFSQRKRALHSRMRRRDPAAIQRYGIVPLLCLRRGSRAHACGTIAGRKRHERAQAPQCLERVGGERTQHGERNPLWVHRTHARPRDGCDWSWLHLLRGAARARRVSDAL